jgi:protein-S-isoprenylcysteine O-methyltransferase Ste14
MPNLELKIPPPVVFVLTACAMWGISLAGGVPPGLRDPFRGIVAAAIVVAGVGIDLASVMAFRRAATTVNPMKPEKTSVLVTAGPYRFSRNPMYAGLLLILLGWGLFLSSAIAFLGPLLFVLYINRFQIGPEERMLALTFRQAYVRYKSRVRRWL